MASASDPTRKGTSDSNVDDDDVNDHREKMIMSLKENPASVLTLSKMLSCDACKSFARAPIRYCGLHHKICSICYTEHAEESDECPAEGCEEKLMLKTFELEWTEMIRAMKLPVQCRNRKNGCPEKGEEEEVEEHEIECEFRFVTAYLVDGVIKMFKDLLRCVDRGIKKRDRKWELFDERDNEKTYNKAYRDSIEPDGHIFRINLNASDSSFLKACTTVFGGECVAKKYRVELRLNSCEKEFTYSHHGPVFSVDVNESWEREEVFSIDMRKFMLFNKGFDYFGDHNKDKNGETIVPITVKIIKKELDIPKEDSSTQVDMGDKEK